MTRVSSAKLFVKKNLFRKRSNHGLKNLRVPITGSGSKREPPGSPNDFRVLDAISGYKGEPPASSTTFGFPYGLWVPNMTLWSRKTSGSQATSGPYATSGLRKQSPDSKSSYPKSLKPPGSEPISQVIAVTSGLLGELHGYSIGVHEILHSYYFAPLENKDGFYNLRSRDGAPLVEEPFTGVRGSHPFRDG
ncbi:hypothetical protein DY000_02020569 [Brassica cretica]|uniref:Uncharacterized protein n=1 Tax=Brassica cretica TaxID=69181 RepID=A0ABQ7ECW0_BRACR|nr:hypothetical protein DY000_02020569 [Brassica cretica]